MTPLSPGVLRRLYLKIFIGIVLFITVLQVASFKQFSLQSAERFHRIASSWSVPFPRPRPSLTPRFTSYGSTQCVPPVSPELLKRSSEKHATCAKYSPFSASRHRWATVTAFFGGLEANEHYTKALTTHLEHALVHGSEVHVLCDKMIDGLWNKPAFILDVLLREMLKPESKRLEWLVWVDGDSLILDQCRPATSFLPSTLSSQPLSKRWRRDEIKMGEAPSPEINLIATHDPNGLNNGIFLLRVSQWAVSLFTAILAYRHYNPDVHLRFSDQSAMELLLADDEFKDQVQYVPQHWFNAFPKGEPQDFLQRNGTELEALEDMQVRKGDWLVHMAGHHYKDQALNGWYDMLEGMEDVWESGDLQRDLGGEVARWWEEKGYVR